MSQEQILLDKLNERELEIIPLLKEGLSNKEIANQLFLAPNTVKWYVKQLNSKLDTSNRHEIVERATELGLLEIHAESSYQRPRQNLPRQTTPFIGRDAELDEIHTIIEKEDVRLLTILAQGGMGKTRIALEASEQQLNRFPDGVYFVPLQALSDVNNIVPQIATSTGFQFSNDGNSQKEQLLNFLSNKTMLLCIDNWEHLLEGVNLINEILQSAPDVKIIATSREKLNLMSETVYVLQGMHYPEWETSEDALEYDAVQLLLQSAQRVKPDWIITPDNLDYVTRVCRLTQGMPLGILLATSWLDVYSLQRICDEIQKSADILETEMRDVPQRQRSIRAVFEHSWERLNPKERLAFMKMSVFRGGCSPSAAEAITGANARILQSLVNKALLLRNREGRYDVHELLRQYAEAELEQSGQMHATRDAHATYYADALQKREKHLYDTQLVKAVEDIQSDFDNAKYAWLWALQRENHITITQMMNTIDLFSHYSVRREEIRELFTQTIYMLPNNQNKLFLTNVQLLLSRLLIRFGNYVEAQSILKDIYDIYDELDCQFGIGQVLNSLGEVNTLMSNLSEAKSFYEQSFVILKEHDHDLEFAYLNINIAGVFFDLGNPEIAYQHLEKCYEIAHSLDYQRLMASCLNNMGIYHYAKGDLKNAIPLYTKALKIRRGISDKLGIAGSIRNIAITEYDQENYKNCKEHLLEAYSILNNYQYKRFEMFITYDLANVEFKFQNIESSKTYLSKALTLSRSIPVPKIECYCLMLFSKLYLNEDRLLAFEYCYQAISQAKELEDKILKVDVINLVTKIAIDIIDSQSLLQWMCVALKHHMNYNTHKELESRLELLRQKVEEEIYSTACNDRSKQSLDEVLETILANRINT